MGRKMKKEETRLVSANVPMGVFEDMMRVCGSHDMTVTQVIRHAIKDYVNNDVTIPFKEPKEFYCPCCKGPTEEVERRDWIDVYGKLRQHVQEVRLECPVCMNGGATVIVQFPYND